MQEKKVCKRCHEALARSEFLPTTSRFFLDDRVDICTVCLNDQFDPTDLNVVDELLCWIGAPFYPDEWITLAERNPQNVLETYVRMFSSRGDSPGQDGTKGRKINWKQVNDVWRSKREAGTLKDSFAVMHQHKRKDWDKKWGDQYTIPECLWLDSFVEGLEKNHNVIGTVQEDIALKLARLSLAIDKGIQNGMEMSKEIRSYNEFIKLGGFEPKSITSLGDFTTMGDFINYLIQMNWKPTYYHGDINDKVDEDMKNNQLYIRRLVDGEPGIKDRVDEQRRKIAEMERMEQSGEMDIMIDNYENDMEGFEFEGADELARELGKDE